MAEHSTGDPWWDGLIGATVAENELHAAARVALLNLLLTDPTVVALYDRWRATTAFGQAVDAYLEWLERTADAAGIDPATLRAAIREAMEGDGTLTLEVPDAQAAAQAEAVIVAALPEGLDRLEAVAAALAAVDFRPLADEAVALVRDTWRLPYPWLAAELLSRWTCALCGMALGVHYHITYWAESDGGQRPAPAITWQFATRPGETVAEASARFLREATDAVITPLVTAASLPRGRRTDERIVRRYVEWWYRRTIRGESIRSIAGDETRRRLVRHGITQAGRWLGLANCRWRTPEETGRDDR